VELKLAVTTTSVTHTRGHSLKLQKRDCSCKTSVRPNFFSYIMVNFWKLLREYVHWNVWTTISI